MYHSDSIVRLQIGPEEQALVWSFVISHTIINVQSLGHIKPIKSKVGGKVRNDIN